MAAVNRRTAPSLADRRMVRRSVSIPAGVDEVLVEYSRRVGLRPAEVLREALRNFDPLLEECRRIDQRRPQF